MKAGKEIIIGITALVACAILYYGFGFLKGQDVFSSTKTYYAIYDHVDGLLPSSGVQYNGFEVGKVQNIYFHPNGSGNLIVEFNISNGEIQIPIGSTAQVAAFDLLGTKGIKLIMNSAQTERHQSGDTISSGYENSMQEQVNEQILPLKNKVESLISQFDSALQIVQGVFTPDFQESISTKFGNTMNSLEHMSQTTDRMLSNNSAKFSNIMSNIESTSATINNSSEDLTKIIKNTSKISDSLAAVDIASTFKKVDQTMTDVSNMIAKIESGEGTLGKLVKDEKLYNNLEQASLELDKLLEDIRVNPRRYIRFGKKDKGNDKPEKKTRNE